MRVKQYEKEWEVWSDIFGYTRITKFSSHFPKAWANHPDRPWFIWGRFYATPDECVKYLEEVEKNWYDEAVIRGM